MYVSDEDNLKLMMVLLKDSSKSIQFEAFHVFKARLLGMPSSFITACSQSFDVDVYIYGEWLPGSCVTLPVVRPSHHRLFSMMTYVVNAR